MKRIAWAALAVCIGVVVPAASASGPVDSPLVFGSVLAISGSVDAGNGPVAQRVRFAPHARFAVGMELQNLSDTAVIVTRVNMIAPPRTLIHQTGGQSYPAEPQIQCPPDVYGCPIPHFELGSGTPRHPSPTRVPSLKKVDVEFDLREGSCADVASASDAPITHLRVTFHTRGGPVQHQVLTLPDGSKLRLRMPKPADCTFPRSNLAVNDSGPLGTDSTFTYPGAKGDICTRTGDALSFRSRAMKNGARRSERVAIRVPHFSGTGVYRDALAMIVVGGATVFRHSAVVIVNKATGAVVLAHVRADWIQPAYAGPPYLIYGAMRCRVRG